MAACASLESLARFDDPFASLTLPTEAVANRVTDGAKNDEEDRLHYTLNPQQWIDPQLLQDQKDLALYRARLRPNRALDVIDFIALDSDRSGDYDPAEPEQIPKKRSSPHEPWEERRKRTEETWKRVLQNCQDHQHLRCKWVVKLRISREKLREMTAGHISNWPTDISPCQARKWDADHYFDEENIIGNHNILEDSLRPRDIRDKREEQMHDITGKPEHRGCWQCYDAGLRVTLQHDEQRCSLICDEPEWPCEHCLESGAECELIRPPSRKRTCERCRSKQLVCNYTNDPTASGPCHCCQEAGFRCIAGPCRGTMPKRFSLEQASAPAVIEDEEHAPETEEEEPYITAAPKRRACSACLGNLAPCSLWSKPGKEPDDQYPPCQRCLNDGLVCDGVGIGDDLHLLQYESGIETDDSNFADSDKDDRVRVPRKRTKRSGRKHRRKRHKPVAPASASPDRVSTPPRAEQARRRKKKTHRRPAPPAPPAPPAATTRQAPIPSGRLKLILPLRFRARTDGGQCSFCRDATYALLGSTGPAVALANKGGTYLCTRCTLERIRIICCPCHKMQDLASSDGVAYKAMIGGLMKRSASLQDRWCSVCPGFAQFECQEVGATGLGCGLRLCKTCADDLHGHGNNFGTFLRNVDPAQSESRPLGLRADVGLLRKGGELMRQVYG